MRIWAVLTLSFGLAAALAGCSSDALADQPSAAPATDIVAPDLVDVGSATHPDAKACKAQGGFLDKRGRLQTAMCVHPYSDAGKPCRDNLECEGKCVAPVDDGPDGQIVGQCQADDALFGCYAEVVDGKSVRAICVD